MKPFVKRYHPPGTPPGTLSDYRTGGATFTRLLEYNEQTFHETPTPTPLQCQAALHNDLIDWLDITGDYNPDMLRQLGETFGLHPLALEDVLNSGQRPKLDVHENHLFLILSLPHWVNNEIVLEQISIFVGDKYLISFCSGSGEVFEPVRARLRQGMGRLRSRGVNYLLYALVDIVIDSAFPLLETLGEQIEQLESHILTQPIQSNLNNLHDFKRDLLLLRRALWPQREVISNLMQQDGELVDDKLRPYFSDCYDHAVQIIDLIETYREMLGSMLDIYLSSLSNRLNEVMRLLTVISTIFIPLTFIVGVYGMNFDHMPELHWRYGYLLVWVVMLALAGGMLALFRWKKWL